jgi:hypothetical protein
MLQYQFRPLENWPWPRTKNRKRSQFKAGYNDTLKLLERELGYLQARNVVIQADCEERMIRQDGMFRADARLRSPCIVLAFDSKHGPLSYPCDTYLNWDCNLRAIALSLEALRSVDRYGVTKRAEQYQGWAKLPAPGQATPMTPQQAAGILQQAAGVPVGSLARSEFEEVYRRACATTHPDVGGDAEWFKRVQAAKDVLDKHFGVAT